MAQRLCLITGGNTGIGYEVAKQLLQRGHEVIIACRDAGRAERAVSSLQQFTSSHTISSVQCDLSSFASVRACAEQVSSRWPKLDVLVCNAAVITQQPTVTNDGYDTMYQVNHLSHFLLAHLLLPHLRKSGRLIVVGSQQHTRIPSELADPEFFHKLVVQHTNPENPKPQQQKQQQQPKTPVPTQMQLYGLTKLYNMWFVKHMAEQVLPPPPPQQQQQQGMDSGGGGGDLPPLVVNAVSPGFVPATDLSRNLAGFIGRIGMKFIMPWAPFAVTVQEGASRVAALCVGDAEGHTNGAYYVKHQVTAVTGLAADAAKAAQLWQQSCRDTGIQQYLPS